MSQVILTILITENIFLTFLLAIYFYRKCQKCQQVKKIDRVLNKLCEKCEKGNGKDKKPKTQYEL